MGMLHYARQEGWQECLDESAWLARLKAVVGKAGH